MNIIKIKNYKNSEGFTTILNNTIRDNTLSLSARGLLIFMLSCNEDWEFSVEKLCKNTNSTRTKIENAIRELEKAKYLIRNQNRQGEHDCRFGKSNWTISETPIVIYNRYK